MDHSKNPKETYTVYKPTVEGATKKEIRSAEELTTDEYYEYVEDDRIISPVNEGK